ncbi:MAG: FtsX-like permease family protein [Marinoscillum sp.]|uniref:FtsX-like permease family protein n=1 Tax=Marinoscillum sp. TaxID=2024838 RepID=UPI00330223B4
MKEWMDWPWPQMLLACTVVHGVMAALLLLFNKFPASQFLARLLIFLLIFLVSRLATSYLFLDQLALASVAISLFLYTRSFFTQKTRYNNKHLLTLMIPAFFSLLSGLEINFEYTRVLQDVSLIIIVVIYLIATLRTAQSEGNQRGIYWFQNPGSRLVWFRNFLIFSVILIATWLTTIKSVSVWEISLGVLTFCYFIYFQIFRESTFLSPIPLGNKYQKSTLTPGQKAAILERLDDLLMKDKFYLQSTISLSQLADQLHTNTHHLSQVINETKNTSFQELISLYRVREAKLLLKSPDQQQTKIENIAAMVGYNSKSAFNTAFKKYTGLTPSEFKEAKGVRSYREERLPGQKRPFYRYLDVSSYHVLPNLKTNMVSNFLKIFYRRMVRNKVFSAINLFGLTVGFSCSILIYLFIADQLSYDKELKDSERIYRIAWLNENPQTRTPHPMAQGMARDLPEVEAATSLSPWNGVGQINETVKVENVEQEILFQEPDFFFVDSTFLDVFSLEVLAGDKDALRKPWSLVITDKMAKKYFGDEDPIGRELNVNDMPVEIAAVIEGMPEKSHFHIQGLVSYVTIKSINPNNPWFTWDDFGHFNYIKIKPGVDHQLLESKIPNWVLPYLNWPQSWKEALMEGNPRFDLQPIQDIHLTSHLRWELENNSNILYVYILTGTLIFLLLIVCINYINLTTAKSLERAREVGIKKTLGAFSENLTFQFYLESLLFCLMAWVLSLCLAVLCLDTFNYLSGQAFELSDIFNTSFLLKSVGLCLILALLAGFYPAFMLSSFHPIQVLKGKFYSSFQGRQVRNGLVVFQFCISSILIISSLIIVKQINFMKTTSLGFDHEAVISIRIHPSVEIGGIDLRQVETLKEQFGSIPGVSTTGTLSNLPGGQFNQNPIYLEESPENRVDASELYVDYSTAESLGLKMAMGRYFDPSYAADSAGTSFLINESAMSALRLENPIGKNLAWDSDPVAQKGIIVGVIKDFHYKSLHESIQPLIIQLNPGYASHLLVKMDGRNFQQTLESIQKTYEQIESELPFSYRFLDEQLANLYLAEERTLSVFSIFAGLALFLACLGLLGLALALLNQKAKEVSIRKIMGATPNHILGMVFSQFARLLGLALLLGLPLGYFLMQRWIGEFSYQVALGMTPFLLASGLLLLVALGSVSLVVLKISRANPADNLRYE